MPTVYLSVSTARQVRPLFSDALGVTAYRPSPGTDFERVTTRSTLGITRLALGMARDIAEHAERIVAVQATERSVHVVYRDTFGLLIASVQEGDGIRLDGTALAARIGALLSIPVTPYPVGTGWGAAS